MWSPVKEFSVPLKLEIKSIMQQKTAADVELKNIYMYLYKISWPVMFF